MTGRADKQQNKELMSPEFYKKKGTSQGWEESDEKGRKDLQRKQIGAVYR